jgi:hypothetical protein
MFGFPILNKLFVPYQPKVLIIPVAMSFHHGMT